MAIARRSARQRKEVHQQFRQAVYGDDADDGRGFPHRLKHVILLRQIHEGIPITYVSLSRQIGQYSQAVGRYVTGRKTPSFGTCFALAKRLGCEPGWLLFGGRTGRPRSPEAAEPSKP